jgi:hypothetical protein
MPAVPGGRGFRREVLVRPAGAERVGGNQEQHPASMANHRPSSTPTPFDRLSAGTALAAGRGQPERTTQGAGSVRDIGGVDLDLGLASGAAFGRGEALRTVAAVRLNRAGDLRVSFISRRASSRISLRRAADRVGGRGGGEYPGDPGGR